jgi:hypothetical protein
MFIYLWHVWKSWIDNAIKNIAILEDCVPILSAFGEIIYSCGCLVDINAIIWAEQQIHLLATRYPNAVALHEVPYKTLVA